MFSNKIVCNIIDYINKNINKKITIDELSMTFYYNKFYIMKLFKREIGYSIFDYINMKRIYNSIQEMANMNKSITIIATNNGFCSLEYFSKSFKNIVGISPLNYKKFLVYNYVSSESVTNIVKKNLVDLQSFVEMVKCYCEKEKPKIISIRKLSIFGN